MLLFSIICGIVCGMVGIWMILIKRAIVVWLLFFAMPSFLVALVTEVNFSVAVSEIRLHVLMAYTFMSFVSYIFCLTITWIALIIISMLFKMSFAQIWSFMIGRTGWRFDQIDKL